MKSVIVENAVEIERGYLTVYPQSSDYGVVADTLFAVVKTSEGYERRSYILEDLCDYNEGEMPTINWLSAEECEIYQQYKINKKISESRECGNSVQAKPGDVIEVYKGRKFPIGSRFIVKESYTYCDANGRERGFYWRTGDDQLVSKFNTIIVGGSK